jgi:broad specificity phosphatase PhoE
MNVYVIRHGQSEANFKRIHSGWSQVPLTDLGFEQAQRVGEVLRPIPFDVVYSSDLLRAQQTAQTALDNPQLIIDERLREINVGTLAGYATSECPTLFGERYTEARRLRDFSFFEGEAHAQQHERAVAFLEELAQHTDRKNVAVFCHDGTVRCMLDHVVGITFSWATMRCDNCSVARFHYGAGHWTLVSWNHIPLTE